MGLLLLCEAAVKPFHERTEADYNADEACKGAKALWVNLSSMPCGRQLTFLPYPRATKGVGKTQPTDWQDAGVALGNPSLAGVYMPKGEGQDVGTSGGYLQYNEVRHIPS